MTRVSISELKAKLSRYVALARSGEEVIVTDRGRPVARLAGLASEAGRSGRLEKLVRMGRVRPPIESGRPDGDVLERPPDPEGSVLAALLDERSRGR